jgi:hypothetical protein
VVKALWHLLLYSLGYKCFSLFFLWATRDGILGRESSSIFFWVRSLLGCTGNGGLLEPKKKKLRVRRVRFLRSLSGKSIRSRGPEDFYVFFQLTITERTLTSDSQHQTRCARTKWNFTSGGQREHRMACGPLRMLLKKIFGCDDSMVKVNSVTR